MDTVTFYLIGSILALLFVIIFLLKLKIYVPSIKEWSSPYAINSANMSILNKTAVLFGQGRNLLSLNFGSEKEILISPAQFNVSYLELLQQSSVQPFTTRELRLFGKISDMVGMIIEIESKDANGQQCSIPIVVDCYMKSEYTKEELDSDGSVIIPYSIKINANTLIRYEMKPNSRIEWRIFYNTEQFNKTTVFKYLFNKQ